MEDDFDPTGIFSLTQEEIDDAQFEEVTDATDMTAEANDFWSLAMMSADDVARLSDLTAIFAAIIHPQHPTVQ